MPAPEPTPPAGLYLHVPFCARVCPYCDFAVVGVRRLPAELEARYVRALLAELSRRCEDFDGPALAEALKTLFELEAEAQAAGRGEPASKRGAEPEPVPRPETT